MIHHISIAANQPQHVAQVLAELCQGQVAEFPYHPGCYIVVPMDSHGTMIEVLTPGSEFTPLSVDGENSWRQNPNPSKYNAFHAAISVPTSEAEIHEIAKREGWHVMTCDRKGYFSVIEVWIENRQLVEFLSPNLAEQYLAFMQPQSLSKFLSTIAADAKA
ncbi:hypothetical protein NIES4071_24150 [Calothrix sp. NIES-4071]|nr:hypothetical protein NIES4071_24150 [Calothrix sp. NIES-4071]BAZ56738.1 hypothetical protein NIES4105_24090 [Calothrix sp. NIES-4105]